MQFATIVFFSMNLQILQRQLLLKQSLFGLPWLLSGALLPFMQHVPARVTWHSLALLILAFLNARFSGMCFNHLIDEKFDAQNPRTKNRPLPAKDVSFLHMLFQALLFLFLFLSSAWLLNPLCGYVSLIVGALVILYSFTKRFTLLCHFVLGSIHFFTPIAAWAAVTGSIAQAPMYLGAALFCSIASGDIIYACQDIAFDRAHGLKSIPAAFGDKKALRLVMLLQFVSVVFLILASYEINSFPIFLSAITIAGLYAYCDFMLYEEAVGHETTFAMVNTLAGLILFVFILGSLVWHAM